MSDFDWEIYLKKAGKKFLVAALISGLSALGAYLGTEPVPTNYVSIVMFGSAVIDIVLNAIKHSK